MDLSLLYTLVVYLLLPLLGLYFSLVMMKVHPALGLLTFITWFLLVTWLFYGQDVIENLSFRRRYR